MNEVILAGHPVTFNAETFADMQRKAGNAWRNAETNGDNFARNAIAALITDSLSPLGLAVSVYSEMEPKKANGNPCEPKESDKAPCGVSVSSLRSAKGGEGARKCLDAVFYIVENRDVDAEAVADFLTGRRGAFRLFPLKVHLQAEKAKAAKAETAGASEPSEPKEDVDGDTVAETLADRIVAIAAEIDAADMSEPGMDDALTLMLESIKAAFTRSAAAEELQQAA